MPEVTAECMVCLGDLQRDQQSKYGFYECHTCRKVFHFTCIRDWSNSGPSKAEGCFRCPACQCPHTEDFESKLEGSCYCGKHPFSACDASGGELNSCGQPCGRKQLELSGEFSDCSCKHPCVLLCHAGPCPPCLRYKARSCYCGKDVYQIKCGVRELRKCCGSLCERQLNCKLHACEEFCHPGACLDCKIQVRMSCFCGKESSLKLCGSGSISINGSQQYSCGSPCDKLLECSNHRCTMPCHEGRCPLCELSPASVKSCACGAVLLETVMIRRSSCLDPVFTCDKVCGRQMPCGHGCIANCHESKIACSCIGRISRKCVCGSSSIDVNCQDFVGIGDPVKCEVACRTTRDCGKHQCTQKCCPLKGHPELHICPFACNKWLSCGLHRCQDTCHAGHCNRCLVANFDEISCNCGTTKLIPPIPCGTNLSLTCPNPCTLAAGPCGHPRNHNCHSGQCPPCVSLIPISCKGGHQQRSVPCFKVHAADGATVSFSCGLPCGQHLSNCHHVCKFLCHNHELREEEICTQECGLKVKECMLNHDCVLPCKHEGKCRSTKIDVSLGDLSVCDAKITVICVCGSISGSALNCSSLVNLKLQVMKPQAGSQKRGTVMVDCTKSECLPCVEHRRLEYLKSSLISGPSLSVGTTISTLSVDLGEKYARSKTDVNGLSEFDSIWFLQIPQLSGFGRKDLAQLLKSQTSLKFQFLSFNSRENESSNMPDVPKSILADAKIRRNNANKAYSSMGWESSCRDQVAWFCGKFIPISVLDSLCTGRLNWVVPMNLSGKVPQLASYPAAISFTETVPEAPAPADESRTDADISNAFEVLENSEPVLESSLPAVQEVSVPTGKKKQKKKSKAVEAEQSAVDAAVRKLEDPNASFKPSNVCPFAGCKEKVVGFCLSHTIKQLTILKGTLGMLCQFCNRKYCMAHRLPEVHSNECALQKKGSSMSSFKKDAKLGIAIANNQTQGGKSGSLAKEREDAKKRLAEKIKNARR